MERFGSLHGVLEADVHELMKVEGIGERAAVLLSLFVPVERQQSLKARQITIDTAPAAAIKPEIRIEPKPPVFERKPHLEEEIKDIPQIVEQKTDIIEEQKPIDINALRNTPEFKKLERILEERNGKAPSIEEPVCDTVAETAKVTPEPKIAPKAESRPTVTPIIEERQQIPHYRIVGETFNSYVIVEIGEKILIIDKHAAHERIIFEELKANMYSADVPSQLLMIPVEIMLMSDEVSALEQYRREIEAVGFEFSTQRNSVSIYSLPMGIEPDAVGDMFTVIADRIKNGTGSVDVTKNIVFEKALYQASCKAAIKAGREYPAEHQKWVVDKLMQIPDITFCPHGRPVAMELSKKNIDRQFERT